MPRFRPARRAVVVLAFALPTGALLLTGGTAAGDDREFVVDLDAETAAVPRSSSPTGFVELDGAVYFTASTEARGGGLYRIDLAAPASARPTIVRAFPHGAQGLASVGGRLFLVAGERETGQELWTSDGTTAGTRLVKDIWPGPRGSGLTTQRDDPLFPLGDKVVFTASTPAAGNQLWSSDGTEAGTVVLSAFVEVSEPVQYASLGVEFDGRLYIGMSDGATGFELWRTDGTAGSAAKVIDLNAAGDPYVQEVTAAGGRLFFVADNGTNGRELFVTGGSLGNTAILDLNPGATSSSPGDLHELNGGLIFHANLPGAGRSLVFLEVPADPQQPPTLGDVIDMNPGPGGSNDEVLDVMGDRLYFVHSGAGLTRGVWATDGTAAGTALISALSADQQLDYAVPVAAVSGDQLYFLLRNTATGQRTLHRTDGTPAPLSTIQGFDADGSQNLVRAAGGRVFLSIANGTLGLEPWQTDGTPGGTTLIENLYPDKGGTDTRRLHVLGNGRLLFGSYESASRNLFRVENTIGVPAQIAVEFDLFFEAVVRGARLFGALNDPSAGWEFGATDGTTAGTSALADLEPGPDGAFPYWIVDLAGDLYFTASTQALGSELYRLPAGAAAPVLVADLNPAPGEGSDPFSLTAVGSKLFFTASTGGDHELFVSDGTAQGTAPVSPGAPIESSEPFAALGDRLVFLAETSATGSEPYVTDGTPGGTALLHDIRPGDTGSGVGETDGSSPSGVFDGRLYFGADDGLSGRELWRTDGTPGGTELFADLVPGAAGSDPNGFAPLFGKLVFTAGTPGTGRELWITDGTVAGTHLLADLNPGAEGSHPEELFHFEGSPVAFFSATTPATGRELFVTDGTARDTRLLADVLPGPGSSSPHAFVRHGDQLSFIAYDEQRGNELRRFPLYRVGAARNVDSDRDGWPDVIEDAIGTAPYDAADRPGGIDLVVGPGMQKSKLALSLRFDAQNRDDLVVSGRIPVPAGLDLSTERIGLNVGGVVSAFTLDAKGRASNVVGDRFRLRTKLRKGLTVGGNGTFSLKITRSRLSEYLSDEGLTAAPGAGAGAGAKRSPPFLTRVFLAVYLHGETNAAFHDLRYKVKKGTTGIGW